LGALGGCLSRLRQCTTKFFQTDLSQPTLEKRLSENRSKSGREQIYSLLFIISLSTPRSYPPPFILVFFLFICRCSLTRSAILASPLCIRPSTSVLCRSSALWLLLLFAGCVFALNESFLLHRSAPMDDLWDEG
jgi:hypothetical protein